MADLSELVADLYADRDDSWTETLELATEIVKRTMRSANPTGADYVYTSSTRKKQQDRAIEKIRRKFPDRSFGAPAEVEESISDWLGVKITCNTTDDAFAFISKLHTACAEDGDIQFSSKVHGDQSEIDVVDYMAAPKESGYRAYHAVVVVGLDTSTHGGMRVEIQVKTRLQDAWSSLTHESFYKYGGKEPRPFYQNMASTMSELLAVVDKWASALALQVAADGGDTSTSGVDVERTTIDPAASTVVVTVVHIDPRYALAVDRSGNKGLIRAASLRDFLVATGKVTAGEYISVDDHLTLKQRLQATAIEENGSTLFEPVSLAVPRYS
ncbi:hypothetical protein ABLE94_04655 [Gordonia sp. VNK1]|uniref:GTP pyrophosphokinase n=1 Tax=Gordonia oleivorans TaxID=3156618 RepID=UPI0032B50530